jgi:AbrB family looped-hinge helix DNA binding protein
MRITSKGQVTIPIQLREKFGLLPRTQVEFRDQGGGVLIKKARAGSRRRRAEEAVRRLRGSAKAGLTTDQIMAMTRGE